MLLLLLLRLGRLAAKRGEIRAAGGARAGGVVGIPVEARLDPHEAGARLLPDALRPLPSCSKPLWLIRDRESGAQRQVDRAFAGRSVRAASGRSDTVRLLVELGWDVSASGGSDEPVEQRWHTVLHAAAFEDDIEMARLVVSLGADSNVRDAQHDSTSAGLAQHAGAERVEAFLEPLAD